MNPQPAPWGQVPGKWLGLLRGVLERPLARLNSQQRAPRIGRDSSVKMEPTSRGASHLTINILNNELKDQRPFSHLGT